MPSTPDLWVALISFDGQDTVQVGDTRAAALYWITTQISDADWHRFYDTLPQTEREGLSRNKCAMEPLALIEAWAGPSDDGEDVWGNDIYLIQLVHQPLWTATS